MRPKYSVCCERHNSGEKTCSAGLPCLGCTGESMPYPFSTDAIRITRWSSGEASGHCLHIECLFGVLSFSVALTQQDETGSRQRLSLFLGIVGRTASTKWQVLQHGPVSWCLLCERSEERTGRGFLHLGVLTIYLVISRERRQNDDLVEFFCCHIGNCFHPICARLPFDESC